MKSCAVLAVQADGARVTTVEGLAGDEQTPLQRSFAEHHALQCGYCTPGMLMSATALLADNPSPTRGRGQGRASRGTSAAAPATGTSSRPWSRPGRRRHERHHERGDHDPPEGVRRPEHPAQGGPSPRRGSGGLLRRRQAARDGLPPLRALAVRARADRVRGRQRSARAARRVRDADGRRGRDPDRPVLPDRGRARGERQGLRARRRQGALPRRAGRRGRRGDERARTRRRGARPGRLRAARRHRRRAEGARGRSTDPPRGVRREHVLQRRLGVG